MFNFYCIMQIPSAKVLLDESKLRSKTSIIPVPVRFINFTNYPVRIYWIDYEGDKRLYNVVKPEAFLDVNTFVTHLWIFENEETGDRFTGEWNFIFSPKEKGNEATRTLEATHQGDRIAVRRIIPITYPLYSLKMRSLQVVRDLMQRIDDVNNLELPLSLKEDLLVSIKKKYCIQDHKPYCNKCPFRFSV